MEDTLYMLEKKDILLIEDDRHIGNWVSSKLEALSNTGSIEWASSIKQARALINIQHPGLIILDLHLPDGNGIELLKSIRKEGITSTVYVFSINTKYKNACLRHGADRFFDKSYESDQLIKAIMELTDGESPDSPDDVQKLWRGDIRESG